MLQGVFFSISLRSRLFKSAAKGDKLDKKRELPLDRCCMIKIIPEEKTSRPFVRAPNLKVQEVYPKSFFIRKRVHAII